MCSIESTGEILGCGTAERCTRIDGDNKEIHVFIVGTVGDGDAH